MLLMLNMDLFSWGFWIYNSKKTLSNEKTSFFNKYINQNVLSEIDSPKSMSLKHDVQYCPFIFDMLGRKKMDQEHFKLISCTESCNYY